MSVNFKAKDTPESMKLICRFFADIWLKLIALTEGMKLSDELLMELYKIAGSDLRKNLLQLQMLISSKIYAPVIIFLKLF